MRVKPYRVLYPLSLLYGAVVWLRNFLFDVGILKTVDVGVPVVSIGNISAGGTGKTPITIEAAKVFLEQGKRVAVISRGYGRATRGTVVVSDGKKLLADATQAGDETVMIARHLPNVIVIADEQRVRGAKKAIDDFHADVIVLDDGFQHRYLERALDIVLLDGEGFCFETPMLPAGYRREPLSSIKRADAIVVTKVNEMTVAEKTFNNKRLLSVEYKFSASYKPSAIQSVFGIVRQTAETMAGHAIVAFCGIAHPEHFRSVLEKLGVRIVQFLPFNDHHRYSLSDVREIVQVYRENSADMILTTEKDAVKLHTFADELSQLPLFSLLMEMSIHQQQQWKSLLSRVIH